jgi:hypothetical protein
MAFLYSFSICTQRKLLKLITSIKQSVTCREGARKPLHEPDIHEYNFELQPEVVYQGKDNKDVPRQ